MTSSTRYFFCILVALWGCADDSVRPEVIDKLRTIGVTRNPSVAASVLAGGPSSANLTAYLALPQGQAIDSVKPFVDEKDSYGLPSTVSVNLGEITYEDLGPLRLAVIPAQMTLPPITDDQLSAFNGVARVRFGMLVLAGKEEEKIVGDILITKPDSELLIAPEPSAEITVPSLGGTRGPSGPLKAVLTKEYDEPIKLSWFVSSGEVTNQFAKETEWNSASPGEQAVILGVYPRRTRSFVIKYQTVVVK